MLLDITNGPGEQGDKGDNCYRGKGVSSEDDMEKTHYAQALSTGI
jgi:hypothetical protein